MIENDIVEVVNMYNSGIGSQTIAKKFGVTRKTINKYLKRNNVIMRTTKDYFKYNPDLNYFEIIDTQNKAYFLGLMFADGWISRSGKNSYSIGISLQEKDGYILDSFNSEIFNPPRKILDIEKATEKHSNKKFFYFNGEKFFNDLKKLGCVERKSNVLNAPENIPKELVRHFIRGFFDGDGGVHLYNQKRCKVTLTSTNDFCSWIGQVLKSSGIIENIYIDKCYNNITHVINIHKKSEIKKFHDYIYEDANFYLIRKKETFDSFLD